MTFGDMQKYVYRRTGHADTPDSSISTRIKQFLNERLRELLTMEGLEIFRRQIFTLASNTSDTIYAVPQAINRIIGIHTRDNDYALSYMPLHEYRIYQPDPVNMQGTPSWYVELGPSAIAKQPSAAAEISVKSSVAGDTAITPYYEFITENNYQRAVTGTKLNGTTAVSADTAIKNVTQISNFFISDTAAGEVTLYQAGDTSLDFIELAAIPIGQTRAVYTKIALIPKPSAADTYHIDAEVTAKDLVQGTDKPPIPEDFHWVICQGALIDEFQKQEKERESKRSELAWFNGIKALKNYVYNRADYIPVIGGIKRRGISRLGPFYPADRFPFS
jgi:hypothetical protein